jgi:transposase
MEEAAMKHKSKRERAPKNPRPIWTPLLERIQPHAAGIDCGAQEHYVAVPPERDAQPVQAFRTFTADLQRLADWLAQCGITTVAMESTGVYWIPLYEILEARGLEVVLVNARHLHNVRGRKSDVSDCQWLQQLHSVGLLSPSFRPDAALVPLRAYLRQRQTLVEEGATHILRMQKALTEMNLMLHVVLSDITGATGLKIIRSILAGERDPARLATHRDQRCKASVREIIAALTGNYRAEHLFALKQNFDAFDFNRQQLTECDTAIESVLGQLAAQQPQPAAELPAPRTRNHPRPSEIKFELRDPLHRLTGGVDLTQLDAIGPHSALQLIAEIGTDMSRWPTEHHFTSWLALAPNNKISGGRRLSSHTQPSTNRAAVILRRCAMSVMHTQTALGAFYRRLAVRTGKAKALTATARKLAILVYRVLAGKLTAQHLDATAYHDRYRQRELRAVRRRVSALGLQLLDPSTGEILNATAVP